MAQTPCPVADEPLHEGLSFQERGRREGGREGRVPEAPEHKKSRWGSGQALPGVHWVYVPQSLASDFCSPWGYPSSPRCGSTSVWGGRRVHVLQQNFHLEFLGSRAALSQSRHISFLTTSTSPGARQLSIRPGWSWVRPALFLCCTSPASVHLSPALRSSWPLSSPQVGSALSSHTSNGSPT